MPTTHTARRLLAVGAALAAAVVGGAAANPADATTARQAPTTKVTYVVPGCEGCAITVTQIAPDGQSGWGSAAPVVNGKASIAVPTSRTHGLVAYVAAPWDGDLGYLTTVVVRYAGKAPGTKVTVAQAVKSDRGTGCWAGTSARSITVPLTVRKVSVKGAHGRTTGTLAFTKVTRQWEKPMGATADGVLRSHGATICHQR